MSDCGTRRMGTFIAGLIKYRLASLFLAMFVVAVLVAALSDRFLRSRALSVLAHYNVLTYGFSEVDDERHIIDPFRDGQHDLPRSNSSSDRLRIRAIDVRYVDCVDIELMSAVVVFKEVEFANLSNRCVDDNCIALCTQLPNLRFLDLSGTAITTTGIEKLIECRRIEDLCLDDTSLQERDIEILSRSASLRRVSIRNTPAANCISGVPGALFNFEIVR